MSCTHDEHDAHNCSVSPAGTRSAPGDARSGGARTGAAVTPLRYSNSREHPARLGWLGVLHQYRRHALGSERRRPAGDAVAELVPPTCLRRFAMPSRAGSRRSKRRPSRRWANSRARWSGSKGSEPRRAERRPAARRAPIASDCGADHRGAGAGDAGCDRALARSAGAHRRSAAADTRGPQTGSVLERADPADRCRAADVQVLRRRRSSGLACAPIAAVGTGGRGGTRRVVCGELRRRVRNHRPACRDKAIRLRARVVRGLGRRTCCERFGCEPGGSRSEERDCARAADPRGDSRESTRRPRRPAPMPRRTRRLGPLNTSMSRSGPSRPSARRMRTPSLRPSHRTARRSSSTPAASATRAARSKSRPPAARQVETWAS